MIRALVILLFHSLCADVHAPSSHPERTSWQPHELALMKEKCLLAFYNRNFTDSSPETNEKSKHTFFDEALGDCLCNGDEDGCNTASSIKNDLLSARTSSARATPLQAQSSVTAYKAQQQFLKKLTEKPIPSMSHTTISQHFKLYEESVARFNALRRVIAEAKVSSKPESEILELESKLAVEYSFIVLHELFFMNTSPNQTEPTERLTSFIKEHYGKDVTGLLSDIVTVGDNDGGLGWIVLLLNYENKGLVLGFLNGYDIASIANMHPLFVVDVWEHAYVSDFGSLGRKEYLTQYNRNIDWKMIEKRLDGGLKIIDKKQKK
ncbi:putative superoxide dismutase [Blattamonas nauphoetae]|uniref:superoxide dismutase n=1 Tax=Blattamonas nauphoetae TaxID=2049346 RepID=A0ABQ9YLQ6_9EUKA|nr:putative superoxide dismutase [Blattamonas nauphoetae]